MTYQFKIQVDGLSNPEVWRQIEVPSDYSFFQLHQVIAAVFDKETDDSMFEFSPSGKDSKPQIISIELPLNDKKNAKVTLLSSVFKRQEQRYAYLLDFIEVWQCTIILEQIINKKISHAECLAGEGAYPPEACADPEDYEKMKLALSDKNHPEHESTREWLELEENETWESAHEFDLAKAREQIKNINTKIKSFRNYTIVKHNAFDEQYGLTPLLWNLINRFKIKSSGNKNKTGLIKEMESLVRKYPAIPHFKNTLATLYLEAGNSDHFFELAHQVFVEYPDYVLARCDLATQYILADQLDKALAFLGDGFNLSELYPDRKDHFTEMETYNYHLCVFQYLLKMEDYKDAQKHLDFLEFLFPDEIWGSALQIQLNLLQMEKMEDQTIEHHLVPVIPEQVTPTDKAPDFEHPEIKILYEQGCDIKRTTLYHIMELPRQTLISDLEKILMDSIARFGYFREHKELDIPDAPFHALQILSALKAEEALDTLFTVLRQDSDYYDFWYGDILTEDFWRFIYMMGQNRLDRLKDFVLEPNHYTYVRSAISIALKQIAIHQPERKDKVLKWFEEVLQYMLDHHDDHNIFEKIVYSSLMNDLITIADKEQLPLVMRLYNKSLLSEQYCFSLKEIKKYLAKKVDDYRVQEKIFTSIDQYYDLWQSWLDDEYDEYDDVFDLDPYAPSLKKSATPFISSPKVGRNDPCPCGSGKKYKKCCGTNE